MIENSTPAPDAPQRRVDDLPLPGHPLEWGDDGTPLPASSVVYLYKAHAWTDNRWMEIKTREQLALIQARKDVFELRTLFTVSVEDLARAPLATILEARLHLDRIKAATEKAISGMREVARETAARP